MKRIAFLLVAVATMGGVVASIALISVAHEEGDLNSLGAILGNAVAIKASREGKLPFPDGAIIAALHWRYVPFEENNKVNGGPRPSTQ